MDWNTDWNGGMDYGMYSRRHHITLALFALSDLAMVEAY